MVKDEKKNTSEPQTAPKLPEGKVGEKVVEPPTENTKQQSDDNTEVSKEQSEETAPKEQNESGESSAQDETLDEKSVTTEDKTKDQNVDKVEAPKNNTAKNKEDEARQLEIEKLIEEKKYSVPIGQVAKKRNNAAILILLIFFVLAAGAYLAIDAGLILKDMTLPFDLIK